MLTQLLVDPMRVLIFAAGHLLGGSLGAGILAVSAALRVLLLPLTLRLARRAMRQQRLLAALQPELRRIEKRHAKEPGVLARKTLELYRGAGYHPFDPAALLGNLAQLPVLGTMFVALRQAVSGGASFLWVANLARPDAALALLVAAISGGAAWAGAHAAGVPGRGASLAVGVSTLVSLAIFWHASAGMLLSWGSSSAVNLVQAALLRRERTRAV
jgi:YidC/Oxa1 family membrane protein insertase